MNTQNTENTQTMTEEREPSQRRRKLLAITAGGLVLGLGGVLTLASWTDQEAAQGSFAAGTFALESSTDDAAFTGTSPESPLSLSFSELADNLSPNDSATAVYAVRLDQSSDYAASVDGAVSATGSAADNLTYQIQQVSDISGTTVEGTMISSESVTSGVNHVGVFGLREIGVRGDGDLHVHHVIERVESEDVVVGDARGDEIGRAHV